MIIIFLACPTYFLAFMFSSGWASLLQFQFPEHKSERLSFHFMIERGLCFGCIAEARFVCYFLGLRNTSIDFDFDMSLI